MSHEAMSWAYRQQVGSAWAKFVLVTLADYADERHSCYPSQATLAGRTEMGVRTIRRALQELERQELIRREPRMRTGGRGRSSDRYVLAVEDQPATSAAGQDGRQVERPTGQIRTTNRPDTHDQPAKSDRGRTVSEPSVNDDGARLANEVHRQLGRPLDLTEIADLARPLLADGWTVDTLTDHLLETFDAEEQRRGVSSPTGFLIRLLERRPAPPPDGEARAADRAAAWGRRMAHQVQPDDWPDLLAAKYADDPDGRAAADAAYREAADDAPTVRHAS